MTNLVSFAASIAELAHGEKSRTKSLNHAPSLFDAPGTEASACASEYILNKLLQEMLTTHLCWGSGHTHAVAIPFHSLSHAAQKFIHFHDGQHCAKLCTKCRVDTFELEHHGLLQ